MSATASGHRPRRGSDLLELFERRGGDAYLGEPVTVREHSLQCAALAVAAGEVDSLVAACLLHDLGWLLPQRSSLPGDGDRRSRSRHRAEAEGDGHAARGADLLASFFPPEVSEPVRLHVLAKRYLVARQPDVLERLSRESRRTLALQGGPLDEDEAAEAESRPFFDAAVRLRRNDDAAKVAGLATPGLDEYVSLLDALAR